MRYNLPACTEKMATIGEIILGRRLGTPRETALAGIAELEAFFASFDIPLRLKDIIPNREHLQQVCDMALQDACLLTNPREATAEDMLAICEEVWK
jgi:alcohol dehydrogenase